MSATDIINKWTQKNKEQADKAKIEAKSLDSKLPNGEAGDSVGPDADRATDQVPDTKSLKRSQSGDESQEKKLKLDDGQALLKSKWAFADNARLSTWANFYPNVLDRAYFRVTTKNEKKTIEVRHPDSMSNYAPKFTTPFFQAKFLSLGPEGDFAFILKNPSKYRSKLMHAEYQVNFRVDAPLCDGDTAMQDFFMAYERFNLRFAKFVSGCNWHWKQFDANNNSAAKPRAQDLEDGFQLNPDYVMSYRKYEAAYYRSRTDAKQDQERDDSGYVNNGSGDPVFKSSCRVFGFARNKADCDLGTLYELQSMTITDDEFQNERKNYSEFTEQGKTRHLKFKPVPIKDLNGNELPFHMRSQLRHLPKIPMALTLQPKIVVGKTIRNQFQIVEVILQTVDLQGIIDPHGI